MQFFFVTRSFFFPHFRSLLDSLLLRFTGNNESILLLARVSDVAATRGTHAELAERLALWLDAPKASQLSMDDPFVFTLAPSARSTPKKRKAPYE